MELLLKQLALATVFLVLIALAEPLTVKSQTASGEIQFGGMQTFYLDAYVCNCSGSNLHYILDYTTNNVIILDYIPGASTLWSNFNPYSLYQLGTYRPGAGRTCLANAGESCVTVGQPYGMYGSYPGTGTTAS